MDPLLVKIISAIETHPELQYESAQRYYKTSIRPAVHFEETLVSDNSAPIGCSKVSGEPDLPADIHWPVNNNKPMHFISQFNCADVFEIHNYSILPPTGLISIFVYENDQRFQIGNDGIKVIYTSIDRVLERRPIPPELLQATECATLTFYKTYSIPEVQHIPRSLVKKWTNIVNEIDTINQSFYRKIHAFNFLMGYPREFNGSGMDFFWAIQALGLNDWDELDARKLDINNEMLRFTPLLHHDFCSSKTTVRRLAGCVTAAFGFYTEELALQDFSKPFLAVRG